MSWTITDTSPKQLHFAHSTQQLSVQLSTASSALSVAENDNAIVCVIGRLRPYDADYLTTDNASWLLSQLPLELQQLTAKIAGFFLLIIADKATGTVRIINDHVGSIPCYIDQRDSVLPSCSMAVVGIMRPRPTSRSLPSRSSGICP